MKEEKRNCFMCGANISNSDLFCSNCDPKLKSHMFEVEVSIKVTRTCKYCNKQISLESKFCPFCGSPYMDPEKDKILSINMLLMLEKLEREYILNKSIDLSYSIATGYLEYCSLYARGDSRKKYLEKSIYHLEELLKYRQEDDSIKMMLGRLLIEEKLIRDLEKGTKYLEEVKSKGNLPDYLEPSLKKAKRQMGDISLREVLNFRDLDPTPAIFIEERKKYRYLINKFIKEKDLENTKKALYEFYNLAFLATLVFPNYDFNLGITGNYYDNAKKIIEEFGASLNYSFDKNGYLDNCKFLSNRDYKIFTKYFGDTKLHTDPLKILKGYTKIGDS